MVVPTDARSAPTAAFSSPMAPPPREIPVRDVRDLALAVIEGAVAAEALAKELKRTPDRSRHFSEIAERLRSVVSRASIRAALAEESGSSMIGLASSSGVIKPVLITPPNAPSLPAAPPSLTAVQPSITAAPATPPIEDAPVSQERALPATTLSELVRAIKAEVRSDELTTRLARLEHALKDMSDRTTAALDRATHAADQTAGALARIDAGERVVINGPADAIALAAQLTQRLTIRSPLVVRIDSSAQR